MTAAPSPPHPAATPRRVERALRTMRELFPSVGPVEAVESWGGLIDCTPGALPAIDAPGRPEGS